MMHRVFSCLWMLVLQYATAQVAYNPNTNTLACSKPGGQYCFNGSLNSPTMLSCISSSLAEIRSCNIELSLILPRGHNESAVCYETSPNTGDAICAFNGTGYTLTGAHVAVPETRLQLPVPDESQLRPDLTASARATQQGTNRKDVADAVSVTTTAITKADMNVSKTNADAPTVDPLAVIVTSSNTSTLTSANPPGPLTSNLPLDPSGQPDTVVSAISSAATTSTGVVTSTGDSTTMVYTTTAVDTSSPRGIVLVEPTSMATVTSTSTSGESNSGSPGSPGSQSPDTSTGSRRTTRRACLIAIGVAIAAGLIRS